MLTEISYSPADAFRRLSHLRHLVFLDSARFHPKHGRWSFLAADPRLILRSEQDCVTLISQSSEIRIRNNPWEILDGILSRFRLPSDTPSETPYRLPLGAAIGYFGYNASRWIDSSPLPRAPLLPAPEAWFGFYDVLLAFDHLERRAWLISSGLNECGISSRAQSEFRRDQFLDELQSEVTPFPIFCQSSATISPIISQDAHEWAIQHALEKIRRGDIYQANLSYPFAGTIAESPIDLYLRLRTENPAPFGAYLDFGDGQILSSSPERFLRMNGRHLQTRPIKGTCSRTGDLPQDWERAASLLQSPKNRAELLMITDLLRNDLGRVAEFGSVAVTELAVCEELETVYHLVSTIEAKLRPHELHLDALSACFPGGSITGAPKLRAMELIDALEPCGRGIYTGSLGYMGFNGTSDFNILIRTLLHRQGEVCFHVGGGIVADSNPSLEYEETLHKAQGLLRLWKRDFSGTAQSRTTLAIL